MGNPGDHADRTDSPDPLPDFHPPEDAERPGNSLPFARSVRYAALHPSQRELPMRSPVVLFPIAALAVVAALPPSQNASGCAVAIHSGSPASSVEVASESAVIVWDEKSKTQHFIRNASFATTSADFGFLVPTPTQPSIEEADVSVFRTLTSVTAPRTVTVVKEELPSVGCGGTKSASFASSPPAAGSVDVIDRKKVGDLEVAVLRADDAGKLREWLEKNGYDARPQLAEWLKVYTDAKWVISAFKIAADRKALPRSAPPSTAKGFEKSQTPLAMAPNANSTTVRMSFSADRPYFPYREPADQRLVSPEMPPPYRLLRVFLLADSRYAGMLGDGKTAWPGKAVWANKLDPATFATVSTAAKLPAELAGREWYLTEFEDSSSPRPGTDEVYFSKSTDQSTIERPPVVVSEYRQVPRAEVVLAILAAVPVLVLIGGLILWRRWFRRALA